MFIIFDNAVFFPYNPGVVFSGKETGIQASDRKVKRLPTATSCILKALVPCNSWLPGVAITCSVGVLLLH